MKNESYNYCHVAELTDTGCKREANEDWMAHFISPNGLVAVVCDGMGGHVGGQIASHTAIDAIQKYMMVERGGSPGQQIVEAMNVACAAILDRAKKQPKLKGMGATCVMLIVSGGKVYIGSVGDSRVYLIRNHTIRQLTVDQSYVQMLIDDGTISPAEAQCHPRRNEITNALGLKEMKTATVLPQPITPEAGDCFLLCSDGLSGMVSDDDICKVVSKQTELSQQERVEELVGRAKQNGGLDNITCQIVEFAITPGVPPLPQKWIKIASTVLGLVALIVLGIWFWPRITPSNTVQEKVPMTDTIKVKWPFGKTGITYTTEQTPDTLEYRMEDVIIEGRGRFKYKLSPFHDATFLVLKKVSNGVSIEQLDWNYKNNKKVLMTQVIEAPLLSLNDMEITPEKYIEKICRNDNDKNDCDDCGLVFKEKLEEEYNGREFDVKVTLHREDQRPHTYIITIPIRKKVSQQ